jgi:hypothetical protein
MAAQMISLNLANPADAETQSRQRRVVANSLMKAAFGDPQVYRRLLASADFRAGYDALNPDLPGFVQEEAMRNIIMVGCLHMIDTTAALLKFARENELQMVPKIQSASQP